MRRHASSANPCLARMAMHRGSSEFGIRQLTKNAQDGTARFRRQNSRYVQSERKQGCPIFFITSDRGTSGSSYYTAATALRAISFHTFIDSHLPCQHLFIHCHSQA
ncbi:hypothetical protein HRR83_004876 [Exophiala dermatitidis]|uniref:Uncharacterized protein n=1 Tax=Exophiala dermatitidis TaxID=5970 RepID=A0AAN6EVL2_EXODE|nr:hypothetical protein HRR74_004959 [Exophiala dermatitidis]KAJ4534587.1 hypothetical protein HRR76_006509 [Exophiala dermatitidis]KAJ4573502.1 hypothetical protein HRR81_004989 [Exophiala dermatitidis]KAJ4595468.1 hypothetical protein HRR84_005675 [Exophiala dermatitidis]KAJ4596325.1 hypothetical protein HRR83_004876 [Exophiala dermatitidis]